MNQRAWIGVAFLFVLAFTGSFLWGLVPGRERLVQRLWLHATAASPEVAVDFDAAPPLRAGDPVYLRRGEAFTLVGRILTVEPAGTRQRVRFALDPTRDTLLREDTRCIAMAPPGDLAWMVRTLLPPDARQQLIKDLQEVWEREHTEALGELRPELLTLLSDVAQILRDTLPEALQAEREAGDAFITALREEFWREKLKPVLDQHFFPHLEARMTAAAEPIAKEIGSSIRDHGIMGVVGMFSMNKLWLVSDEAAANALKELLTEAAFPVLKKRAPELAKAAFDSAIEAANRPEIQDAINLALWDLVNHETFQRWSQALVERWIVRNDKLVARLSQALRDQRLRKPVRELGTAMEPVLLRHLEDALSRDDREGMDHRLVRVLRRQVLWKDQRYLLLEPGEGSAWSGSPLHGELGRDP